MEDRMICDIGMHKGEDTDYYLRRGFRVVGVEADPVLVEHCRGRFAPEIGSGQLVIVHGAIVDDDTRGSVRFFQNPHKSVWGTTVPQWAERNARLGAVSVEIEVPVVRLGELFVQHGCPHYLKIDIEGMDLVCLEKLLKTDCRPRYVSMESEKVDFRSLIAEFDVFHALGYTRFFIQQQANMPRRKVPRGSIEGLPVDHVFPRGSSGPFGSDLGTEGWLTRDAALVRYNKIFREYRWLGDASALQRLPYGRDILRYLSKKLQRPLPGWYDTHAARE